jgi:hypothetical protein
VVHEMIRVQLKADKAEAATERFHAATDGLKVT